MSVLFQLLGDLEEVLGAASFHAATARARRGASAGGSCPSSAVTPAEPLELEGLFNPLLLVAGEAGGVRHRPSRDRSCWSPGPELGRRKTRLLQGIAIAQLLAEVGLFAPARAARIPRASGLFASLFEERMLPTSSPRGTSALELLRIRRCFDELDSGRPRRPRRAPARGTNPSEGEEIARLVLSLLPELGVRGFVTTHLLEVRRRALGRRCAAGRWASSRQVELRRPGAAHVPLLRPRRRRGRRWRTRPPSASARDRGDELLQRIAAKRARLLASACPTSGYSGSSHVAEETCFACLRC